ncbi:MAG: AAA family ATPase, partial [Kiritimatiellae bacterium]|nr:AAA family ATPase [Kiritimatiellia bacterium]
MHKEPIAREVTPKLLELAGKYPVVTITGPRQSGKTTLARYAFPDKRYANLEMPDVRAFAREDPRGFLEQFRDKGGIIDEIQRVPELTSYIQGVTDEAGSAGQFILTGSQQFEMMNSVTQSLAGRTALIKLPPFSLSELPTDLNTSDWDGLLYRGFYPRIIDCDLNPTQALADYTSTYLERDL